MNSPNIYFTSDSHFHHANICSATSEWSSTQRCRDFPSLEAMNKAIVYGINSTVGEDDTLYHLGDWSFGGLDNIWNFRKQIKCKNIHLILGNHDHHIENNKWLKEPSCTTQELFTSVNHYKEISVKFSNPDNSEGKYLRQRIVMCHYAFRVFNKSHHGAWNLYGHSHGTLDEFTPKNTNPTWIGDEYYIKNYKCMDVGIDTHPEFRPYSFEELQTIMDKREVLLNVDHHDETTN